MNNITTYLADNWCEIIILIAVICCTLINLWIFISSSKETKIKKIKSWLLIAVTEAERVFGSKTGEIKLAFVYDEFSKRFPILSKFITIELFNKYVDEALDKMRILLTANNPEEVQKQ